jgi:hypothetical protein
MSTLRGFGRNLASGFQDRCLKPFGHPSCLIIKATPAIPAGEPPCRSLRILLSSVRNPLDKFPSSEYALDASTLCKFSVAVKRGGGIEFLQKCLSAVAG